MEKPIAKIKFEDLNSISPVNRKLMATWLRKLANTVAKDDLSKYSPGFTSQFYRN
jgi:hypothetical protein